jgi:hypothetical protein
MKDMKMTYQYVEVPGAAITEACSRPGPRISLRSSPNTPERPAKSIRSSVVSRQLAIHDGTTMRISEVLNILWPLWKLSYASDTSSQQPR